MKNMELNKLNLVGFVSIILLITFMHLASASNENDQYKPYLHTPSVGNVPKLETFGAYQTQLFQGAGTYVYSLAVPPGNVGLQPAINLAYNSQTALQRPGILGSGWSLTENSITRNVNYTVNNADDDYFVLSINNNRLKLFYNGSNWNAELNPRQLRIENLTNDGKQYWIVTTTDGTKYRFGFNNDSLLESNTGKNYDVKWSLDLVQDIHNNSIFYSYKENPFTEDIGAAYLQNISYNNDQLKVVTFAYETQTRPDRRIVFEQGNRLSESRRLSEISVFFNNSLVRKYSLNYVSLNDEKSMSSISDIIYIGSDGSSVLNTIRFEYYNTTQGFDNTTGKWITPESFAFSSVDLTGKDFGVRLIDVNNDGFPDLVKSKAGTNETRLNNKISGWNVSSRFTVPVEIVSSENKDQGVRFDDINGDGLIDIIKAKGGTRVVYLNNGTGWNANSNWNIPVDFVSSGDKYLGAELVDLNGDGKVDILKANESTKETYINNGTGWQSVPDWKAPDYFVKSNDEDTGLRLLDLNGDGLSDLIKGGKPGNAWLNNGTGWTNYSQYAPDLEFVSYPDKPDLGVRFMDINGDGLVDILQNFYTNFSLNLTCYNQTGNLTNCTYYNVTIMTNTKVNNGSGWVPGNRWISPEEFTASGYNIGRRIADVNGDGYADIIVAYQASPFQGVTHVRNATNSFILKKITNAYGGLTQLYYKQSTLSDNGNNLGFNIWLVGNTSMNNSLSGDFAAESKYSYLYAGGKFDYNSKEFRGFAQVNETLPDNSTISHFFHQDAVLKGKEYQTSLYDSSSNYMVKNLNSFSYSPDNMIYLNQTSSQVYDGSATPLVNNITFKYDYFGNVNSMNNSGDVDIAGDGKLEVFNYGYNMSTFVVSKPANYTLFSENSTLIKQTLYFYDNLTSGLTKGDLTRMQAYNNRGVSPETKYAYDSFGNIIKETQPRGQNTTYIYDSTGAYIMQEINQIGHQINYGYDFGTGNLLSETRSGLNKTYTYDLFGRIKTEIISPDTVSSPTKNYTYSFDGLAPEIIKIEIKSNGSNYSEVLYFYDGFSDPVQIKYLFDAGKQLVKNYFYDSKFRIKEEQNPYFDAYSVNLSLPSNVSKIRYSYDSLDRVINLTKQDNNSINIIFNKSSITQLDENGNRIDYVVDPYSRIKSITEYFNNSGSQETYTTSYSYRPDDSLMSIVDTKGNNFTFEYDSLGRKISYDDPNMNPWRYSYDLNGNLVNQTDGRNTTTFLTYDALNRIILKKAGSSNITFVYDGQFNGTLTNITSDGNYFKIVRTKYVYDNRLRIIEKDTFVYYYETSGVGGGSSEWINVSAGYDSQDRILNMYLPNTNLNYEYNSIGKLSEITGFLNSINYNEFGKTSNKTYSNNLVTQINYDTLGRISQLQTGAIQNLGYVYDPVGNINEINDAVNSKEYGMGYDSLNRLTTARIEDLNDNSNQTFKYTYNSIANLLGSVHNEKNILNPTSSERVITAINLTYGNLVHAPSVELVSRSPQINVTVCGVLKFPDTTYLLQSDISTNATCFTVTANNVTLNGNGHTIAGNDSQNIIGIEAIDVKDLMVKNMTIRDFDTGIYFESEVAVAQISVLNVNSIGNVGNGIWVYSGGGWHILYNVNASYNALEGIRFEGTSAPQDASLANITASYNQRDGILLMPQSGTTEFTLTNIVTNNNTGHGVKIYPAWKAKIKNLVSRGNWPGEGLELAHCEGCIVSDSDVESVRVYTSSTNSTFLNVSYSEENVSADSNLVRRWYYRAFTNNTEGNNVSNSNITAYNSTGSYQFNLTTGSSGFTNQTEIIDYFNNGGSVTYYSPYTIYASNANYTTINHERNITNLTNIYRDLFIFGLSGTPNDTIKFYLKNASGSNIAWLGDKGNIVLAGECRNLTEYNLAEYNSTIAGEDAFKVKNSAGNIVSFIDEYGNMGISQGSCDDAELRETCNPSSHAFIVQNSSDVNMSYTDYSGGICLTGNLYEFADSELLDN